MAVLKYVDVLLPNEHEACKISRTKDAESAAQVASEPGAAGGHQARPARRAGAAREATFFRLATQPGDVVDAVGAGDSFDAGFIHQYIRGARIEECIQFGNIAGALSVTRAGGTEAFRVKSHRETFLQKHWKKTAIR